MKSKKRLLRSIVLALMLILTFATTIPTFAATKEVPITQITFPTSVTIKVGEVKTLSVAASPSNTTYKTNIEWGVQSNSAFSYKTNGYGTYWKQASSITLTGTKAGKGYLNTTVKLYNSEGKYIESRKINTTVTVAAANSTGSNTTTTTTTNKNTTTTNTTTKNTTTNTTNKNTTTTNTTTKNTTTKIALQSISLSSSSLTMTKGGTSSLTVKYNPTNTTDNKTVSWSSSNSSVASVSSGRVTAKKAGTATIAAKVGSKTATCKVTVKEPQKAVTNNNGSYKNVSDAYKILNDFRTKKSNQWYWKSNNKTKQTVYGLKGLKKDATLEKVAKERAKEQWTQYYVKGKVTHDRLNGKSCWTAYPKNSKPCGENLAWGQSTSKQVILDPDWGWAETNFKYSGQGHRRNMLSKNATRVGIACYVKDGKTCWAMCLGY